MIKKLTKHGNSLALVIDKPILDLLNITADTPLEVSTDGRSLVVAPANPVERRKRLRGAIEDTHRKYGKMMKRLAD